MMMTNDQMVLFRRIQMLGFVLLETNLFLDTHPTDQAVLEYYRKYARMYSDAMKEYTEKFGPISVPGDMEMKTWKWIDQPWPWEIMEG